jgi:hypothetical protein
VQSLSVGVLSLMLGDLAIQAQAIQAHSLMMSLSC